MSTTYEADEQVISEILEAEQERLAAIHASDWSRLSELLGDDLTYTHMNGLSENKEENITALQARPRFYEREGLSVRTFGDVAVLHGLIHVSMDPSPDGTPARQLHGRVTQVWARRDGRWQMVVFQATALPDV
ncbi:MAG: nuclear transport factor 2 family protein [Acidimicrobiaceae bacterium]|nr:nuclear transport factor 2 family protein [Acidimicrobiaceae bacterium]